MTYIPTYRDVACVRDGSMVLLTSVDAAAGIGPAPGDSILAELADVAYFVSRTAAVELIALNVPVVTLTIGASVPASVAALLRAGAEQLSMDLGSPFEVAMSHENYFRTHGTAIVTTAVGWRAESALRCQPITHGNLVFVHGNGYTRQQITRFDRDMPRLSDIVALTNEPGVHQVIPVGSRGARHDLDVLSAEYDLAFVGDLSGLSLRGGPGLQFLVVADAIPLAAGCRSLGKFVAAGDSQMRERA